jgi:hypothetical protein
MNEEDRFQALARTLVEKARDRLTNHPSPDELLAYQRRDLPAATEEQIQEHLSLCASCARVVLDLETFPEVEPVVEHSLPAGRITTAWEELREKTGIVAPGPASFLRSPRPLLAVLASRGFSYALAGCLLAAVVGLTLRVGQLQYTVGELREPHVNVFLADLLPTAEGRTRSQGGRPRIVRLPAGSDRMLLLPGYLLEIEDSEGRLVWTRRSLARSPDGNFTLEVPRGFLVPGVHHLRLYGLAAGEPEADREPLAAYNLELIYE